MADQDMVSIVVPVYNAEKYIAQTIESVLAQTYTAWELILVVDASPDQSLNIIQSFTDKRIHSLVLDENHGAAEARNIGIRTATGRYIGFIDADDVWRPEKLIKEIDFMKEQQAGFAFTGYEFGDSAACPTGKIVKVPQTITYKQALSNTTIFTSTVLFDTTIIPRELIEMPLVKSEDTALWWKILRNGYLGYGLNENLVIYRRPEKSLSSNKWEAMKRIWNLYRKVEHLNFFRAGLLFLGWAVKAVKRRV